MLDRGIESEVRLGHRSRVRASRAGAISRASWGRLGTDAQGRRVASLKASSVFVLVYPKPPTRRSSGGMDVRSCVQLSIVGRLTLA